MSRKHFRALAAAIAKISDPEDRRRTAHLVGEVCATCNSNFNWSRFLNACGVTG
jgi:hypothetical protein